jgi:hypothetical protein
LDSSFRVFHISQLCVCVVPNIPSLQTRKLRPREDRCFQHEESRNLWLPTLLRARKYSSICCVVWRVTPRTDSWTGPGPHPRLLSCGFPVLERLGCGQGPVPSSSSSVPWHPALLSELRAVTLPVSIPLVWAKSHSPSGELFWGEAGAGGPGVGGGGGEDLLLLA